MESVSTILRRSLLLLVLAACTGLIVFKFAADWREFQDCPNRDVLSWDANLRLIYTLDARDDFLTGHPVRAAIGTLRSPTWPPLHGWIAMTLFAFQNPSTVLDAGIGQAFYALLCVSLVAGMVWLSQREGLPAWTGGAAALFTLMCLFHSKELTAYSLSAMLETQGMFFLLLTMLALSRAASPPQSSPWWLLASSLGLFLTKFPYGHLLIMALVPAALLHERQALPALIGFLRGSYRGRALLLPAAMVLIVLFLALARFLPGTPPNVKVFKYIFYLVVTILFVDFNVRVYRSRAQLTWVPELWRQAYLFVCVPILLLTFLEPDRFSSTVGTQLHEQDSSRSFFLSLFLDFADSPWPVTLLFLLVTVTGVASFLRRPRTSHSSLGFVFSILVLHILILEVLTSNKQLRHIYHLLPAFLGFTFIAAVKLESKLHNRVPISGLVILVSTTVFVMAPGSLFGPAHHQARYTCWTGPDRGMFQPVRDAVAAVPPIERGKVILLNDFHDLNAPMPGRIWATDIDLLLRFRLNFKARNDSRHAWKTWDEFDRLLHVSAACGDATDEAAVMSRASEARASLKQEAVYRATGSPICITEYRISRNVGIQ
jgi:hypothetical protein